MIYNSAPEIFEMIDETRGKLIKRISALTDSQKNARDDENGWSVAEICEHLATVEGSVIKIVGKLLAKAESVGKKSVGAFDSPISFAEQAQSIAGRKLTAPEMTRPKGLQSVEESLTKLAENRRALNEIRPRIETVDSTDTAFPHPFFGSLNLYQWLVMIGAHEFRHLQQIENILAEKV